VYGLPSKWVPTLGEHGCQHGSICVAPWVITTITTVVHAYRPHHWSLMGLTILACNTGCNRKIVGITYTPVAIQRGTTRKEKESKTHFQSQYSKCITGEWATCCFSCHSDHVRHNSDIRVHPVAFEFRAGLVGSGYLSIAPPSSHMN